MKTLEFLTVIENGVIHLPERYKAFNNVKVRIVMVSEEETKQLKRRGYCQFQKSASLECFWKYYKPY